MFVHEWIVMVLISDRAQTWLSARDMLETKKGMPREVPENEQPGDNEPIRGEADLREIWPFDLKE